MKTYVKEYNGHKVPDGATHYVAETDQCREFFYKKGFFQFAKACIWIPASFEIPAHAIELLLVEEEFEPAVGEWFMSPPDDELFYIGIDCEGEHLCNEKNGDICFLTNFDGCKPLKSDRDIAIEKAVEVWKKEGQPESSSRDWPNADILGSLYDAGLLK